jgi:anti-anti-sigma regulatory factor
MTEPNPYTVERLDNERAVVRLPEYLDDPRTEAHGLELQQLIEGTRSVAVDASRSMAISSDWIRFLFRLTSIAEQAGKLVGIVGLSEVLMESADVLGIKDKLEFFDGIEEVWEA